MKKLFFFILILNSYTALSSEDPHDSIKVRVSIPGKIQEVFVKDGQYVKKGQLLFFIEAMKMEIIFRADEDGVIKTSAAVGDAVHEDSIPMIINRVMINREGKKSMLNTGERYLPETTGGNEFTQFDLYQSTELQNKKPPIFKPMKLEKIQGVYSSQQKEKITKTFVPEVWIKDTQPIARHRGMFVLPEEPARIKLAEKNKENKLRFMAIGGPNDIYPTYDPSRNNIFEIPSTEWDGTEALSDRFDRNRAGTAYLDEVFLDKKMTLPWYRIFDFGPMQKMTLLILILIEILRSQLGRISLRFFRKRIY